MRRTSFIATLVLTAACADPVPPQVPSAPIPTPPVATVTPVSTVAAQPPIEVPPPPKPIEVDTAAVAKKLPELPDRSRVLTFCYDTGERYLSVEGLFPAA